MERFGIEISLKNSPKLDSGFLPMNAFNRSFLKTARQPLGIAVERANGGMATVETFIHGGADRFEADKYYVNRLIKTLLWMKGGYKIYIRGSEEIFRAMAQDFSTTGCQSFDFNFMATVFERPFEVVRCDTLPAERNNPQAIGRHLDGCRIGFDAGGSDRKVSAVIDGESVFDEEVVWFPKTNSDPDYHFQGIVDAMKAAAAHMPRVDAIGISSAGIYINNRTMSASLFLKVDKADFDAKVKDIYLRAAAEIADVPVVVCNDGDVSALAGAMSLGENNVLGIAMGTSEAVGYVDEEGRITGWLNELAFVPVDASESAMPDEWSGDIGCGVKYFSQDAVIKLAPAAGIELDANMSPAEKLKVVQNLMAHDDPRAADIYSSVGVYLAHALALYFELYHYRHVLLLGRVMSGRGGDLILETCKAVLADEYPDISKQIHPTLPDEKFRRVGQSAAAASLPELRN